MKTYNVQIVHFKNLKMVECYKTNIISQKRLLMYFMKKIDDLKKQNYLLNYTNDMNTLIFTKKTILLFLNIDQIIYKVTELNI